MDLRWSEADHQARGELQSFECAFPPKVSRYRVRPHRHPRPWQATVQSYVRSLRTPYIDPDHVLIGRDEGKIAAVVAYCTVLDAAEPPGHFVKAIARANAYRGTGVADSAMAELLRRLRGDNNGFEVQSGVYGKVHSLNSSGRAYMRRHGFEAIDRDEDYEIWARAL